MQESYATGICVVLITIYRTYAQSSDVKTRKLLHCKDRIPRAAIHLGERLYQPQSYT